MIIDSNTASEIYLQVEISVSKKIVKLKMNILFWIILELYIGTLKFYIKKYAKKFTKYQVIKSNFDIFLQLNFTNIKHNRSIMNYKTK